MQLFTLRLRQICWLLLLAPLIGNAGVHKQIHFAPGASGTVLEGAVTSGDQDQYELNATPGQKMDVEITSDENNAVFQIYGEVEGQWVGMTGADEGDDATSWNDTLPDGGSGSFKIVVGPTRGNATYVLKLTID